MNIRLLSKVLSSLAVGAALVGCTDAPLPDPYYLQIGGVKLAIPKKYTEVGSGLNSPSNYSLIRQTAATPPGMEIGTFRMRLDFENAKPEVYDPNLKGAYSGLEIWFSLPEWAGKGREVETQMKKKLLNDRRRPQKDMFGLLAYADFGLLSYEREISDWYYLAKDGAAGPFILRCKGFGFENPLCQATFTWHGLVVEYEYRHIYLNQWQNTHKRVVNLLESFKVSDSR